MKLTLQMLVLYEFPSETNVFFLRIFIIVDANELKEDGHGSKVVLGRSQLKVMSLVPWPLRAVTR